MVGNQSNCAGPFQFINDQSEPTLAVTGSNPATPSNATTGPLLIKGTATGGDVIANSTVYVFAGDKTCNVASGFAGSGPLADFTSGGISVSPFPSSGTTDYYAFSQDDAGNQSTCVGPFTFVDDQSEAQPTITSSTPTTPSNTNPSTITLTGDNG